MSGRYDQIEVRVADGVAWLRLNRPGRLNALTEVMLGEIDAAVDELNGRADVSVVVLAGHGRAFCAGRDKDELDDVRTGRGGVPSKDGHATVRIADLEVPVVCAVQGAAVGGGLGMVLMCDVVLAAESAYLVDGHLAVDMCPSSSAWWLPRLVSYQRAMEIFLSARRVPAAEAAELGLAARVVPDDQLEDEAGQLAASIAARSSRSTLIATKRAVRFGLESTFARSIEHVAYLRALT